MRIVRIGFWPVVLSLLFLPCNLWAQAAPMRNLTRGLLWSGYRSNGIQGKTEGMTRSWTRLWDAGLMYPGAPILEGDFEDHWAVKESIDFADRSTHTSQGEGIYVLTKDENGFYNVSMSNPRIVTEDIVPMTYDASAGPEKDLGVRTVSPFTGAVTANYWPGAPPVVNDVTEIHNFGLQPVHSQRHPTRGNPDYAVGHRNRDCRDSQSQGVGLPGLRRLHHSGGHSGEYRNKAVERYLPFIFQSAQSLPGRAHVVGLDQRLGGCEHPGAGRLVQVQRSTQFRWPCGFERKKDPVRL